MTHLRLRHFTQDQISEALLYAIKVFIEERTQQTFKWDSTKYNYNILICDVADDIIAIGIAKDPGVLEYLCVDERYKNQSVGLKMLDNFVKIYSSLRMMVTPDIHVHQDHFDFAYDDGDLIIKAKSA